jgi:phosphate transport system permease protein
VSGAAIGLRGNDRRRRFREGSFQALLLFATGLGLVVLAVLLIDVSARGSGRLSPDFLTSFPSRRAESAGVKAALVGSMWLIGLTAAIAVPISIAAAIYLEEIAPRNRFTALVEINISNLAGVPSIVYGIIALAFFGRTLGLGASLWTGAIALALLVFPVIVIAAREALRAVPSSIRDGAYALGATQLQMVRRSLLPPAVGGMLTGIILALSRAIGEAAPLLLLGALVFTRSLPEGPNDRFTALPLQIFNWVSRPQEAFQVTAAAGIMVLVGALLILNAIAIFLRNRSQVEW